MKSLKALLLLAVFCLTVSGSSYDKQPEINDTLEINKEDYKITEGIRGKLGTTKPDMG